MVSIWRDVSEGILRQARQNNMLPLADDLEKWASFVPAEPRFPSKTMMSLEGVIQNRPYKKTIRIHGTWEPSRVLTWHHTFPENEFIRREAVFPDGTVVTVDVNLYPELGVATRMPGYITRIRLGKLPAQEGTHDE
jgi:hypothetical protein